MKSKQSKKELMIIDRTSPPDFKRELIYSGKIIPFKDIPKTLNLNEEARKYYWEISWIERQENQIHISQGIYDYKELLAGEKSYGINSYREIDILLNRDVRKGLLGLLSLS